MVNAKKSLPKNRNGTFFRSALFHMKTRVCLKYFVNDCAPWFYKDYAQCDLLLKSLCTKLGFHLALT